MVELPYHALSFPTCHFDCSLRNIMRYYLWKWSLGCVALKPACEHECLWDGDPESRSYFHQLDMRDSIHKHAMAQLGKKLGKKFLIFHRWRCANAWDHPYVISLLGYMMGGYLCIALYIVLYIVKMIGICIFDWKLYYLDIHTFLQYIFTFECWCTFTYDEYIWLYVITLLINGFKHIQDILVIVEITKK